MRIIPYIALLLVFLIIAVLRIPTVEALDCSIFPPEFQHDCFIESRAEVINNTYILVKTSGIGEEITLNESSYLYRWVDTNWTFEVHELDADIEMWIEPLNDKVFKVKFQNGENATQQWTEVPIWACVNGTEINRFQRFEVDSTPYCNYGTMYHWDVPINEWYMVNFLQHPTPTEIWYGDGGGTAGDGLPTCQGMTVHHLQNQSWSWYNTTYRSSGRWLYISAPAGCTMYVINWEVNHTNYTLGGPGGTKWVSMLPTPQVNVSLHCTDSQCYTGYPSSAIWYYEYPMCDKNVTDNVSTRIHGIGLYNGKSWTGDSNILYHNCIYPTFDEDDSVWFIGLFMGIMLVMFYMFGGVRDKDG